jgi:hypothetical protein
MPLNIIRVGQMEKDRSLIISRIYSPSNTADSIKLKNSFLNLLKNILTLLVMKLLARNFYSYQSIQGPATEMHLGQLKKLLLMNNNRHLQ